MPTPHIPLSVTNHDRDRTGMRYVYPVVSRRAGGVSIGINLNPNNACNWACVYCQVPDLTRGGPPPLDLNLLEDELARMLDDVQHGDFMQREVAPEARRLMDVAFSGNGEPTSAPEFAQAVAAVLAMLRERGLLPGVTPRLITNGSLLGREAVREGIALLGAAGGEVWFKVDAADRADVQRINGVPQKPEAVEARLRECAALAPTWVQTCMFVMDGAPPSEAQLQAYLELLAGVAGEIRGVLLYGLARPSMQPEAVRLAALPAAALEDIGVRIKALGLPVRVSL